MKTEEFHVLTAELEKLTPHQRSVLVDCLHKIEHVQAVSTLVESRVQSKPLRRMPSHVQRADRNAAGQTAA